DRSRTVSWKASRVKICEHLAYQWTSMIRPVEAAGARTADAPAHGERTVLGTGRHHAGSGRRPGILLERRTLALPPRERTLRPPLRREKPPGLLSPREPPLTPPSQGGEKGGRAPPCEGGVRGGLRPRPRGRGGVEAPTRSRGRNTSATP